MFTSGRNEDKAKVESISAQPGVPPANSRLPARARLPHAPAPHWLPARRPARPPHTPQPITRPLPHVLTPHWPPAACTHTPLAARRTRPGALSSPLPADWPLASCSVNEWLQRGLNGYKGSARRPRARLGQRPSHSSIQGKGSRVCH